MNPDLENALTLLTRGGLVAFPTETVYGLGADASNGAAVSRIFSVKGRPLTHPVIVHIAHTNQMEQWACNIPESAYLLAERFWPGPLTLVLKRALGVSDIITGGQDTVALRIPAHHIALALLTAFGKGVAAPSANRYGRLSPTTAQHVLQELGDDVDMILDGGSCAVGIESTIIDLSGENAAVLRPGWIPIDQINATLGTTVIGATASSPRVPGAVHKHYAPKTPVILIDSKRLNDVVYRLIEQGERAAVLAYSSAPINSTLINWYGAAQTAAGYARTLYAMLREIDGLGCARIVVETPPQSFEWDGVNDRLLRAAASNED